MKIQYNYGFKDFNGVLHIKNLAPLPTLEDAKRFAKIFYPEYTNMIFIKETIEENKISIEMVN